MNPTEGADLSELRCEPRHKRLSAYARNSDSFRGKESQFRKIPSYKRSSSDGTKRRLISAALMSA